MRLVKNGSHGEIDEIIHTRDQLNSKFNATFGRGLIQLLRTMRFVFGMHRRPYMISEIRTPG